jgi:molybdopterin converting factor small subunit
MKIDAVRGASQANGARRANTVSGEGFSLPTEATKAPTAAAPVSAPSALGALLSLQIDEGRRARQARRGTLSLDAMDALQAALLDGTEEGAALAALRSQLAGREPTGDAALDDVLNDIDVRTAVELAKRAKAGTGVGAARA